MTEKSEALRLADVLDHVELRPSDYKDVDKAAAELRRLHAENEKLRKQRDEIFTALMEISMYTHLGGEVAEYGDVVEAVRQMRDRMIADGWRQCAQGQKTTQHCGMAEQARAEEREACAIAGGAAADAGRDVAAAIRARGSE